MLLAIYLITIFSIAILAIVKPSYDVYFSILLALALSLVCGSRDGGFDYDEYQSMISGIRFAALNGEALLVILQAAKDPGIAVIVHLSSWFTDTDFSVFFFMALLGFVPKFIFALSLPKYKTMFIALYAVFLAPGLEFAAIRSAVAIGFLGLAITVTLAVRYRTAFFLVAGAFHASIFAGVFLLFKRFWRIASSNFWFTPLISVLITSVGLGVVVQLFESRGVEPGTILAPFFPVITLICLFFFSRQKFFFANAIENDTYLTSFAAATFFASMAMAMAIPIAVSATRFLEISYFFVLFAFLMALSRNRLNALSIISLSLMGLVLVFTTVSRLTWAEMARMSFG